MAKKFEKDEFEATYSQFASGDIGQSPFNEQGPRSFQRYSQIFGKYLADKEEEKNSSEEEKLKRERRPSFKRPLFQ